MPPTPAPTTPLVLAITTVDTPEAAQRLALVLVERRLAACVSVVPGVRSTYRWKGTIEEAGELLVLVKTTEELVGDLEAALGELHPYEVPELVVVPASHAGAPYLAWVLESLKEPA